MTNLDIAQAAKRPRLAIQKDGRLTQETVGLLNGCGLTFDTYRTRLLSPCRNFPLAILAARDDDIPGYVANGTADMGIVGRNILLERGDSTRIEEIRGLGFGQCRLVIAVPNDSTVQSVEDLAGRRIATTYPRTVGAFFAARNVPVTIIEIAGGVEIAPALGVAEAIADLTATGSSLLTHDLRTVDEIASSEAVLIAAPAAMRDPVRRAIIDRFVLRLNSALAAKRYRYIMMNAPRAALPHIRAIVPGLRMPTIIPLEDPEWVSVHTVLAEDLFWEKIEALRSAGASEILVANIEKLVI